MGDRGKEEKTLLHLFSPKTMERLAKYKAHKPARSRRSRNKAAIQNLSMVGALHPQELKHPEWLQIRDDGSLFWGGDQEWFPRRRQQKKGCSAVTAAQITAYMARKSEMVSLFRPYREAARSSGSVPGDHIYTRTEFCEHMEDLWACLTPGPLGLPRPSSMQEGLRSFCISRGLHCYVNLFTVPWYKPRSQKLYGELRDFIQNHLLYDMPLAMLSYSKGGLSNLEHWHWVTVIGTRFNPTNKACRLTVLDHLDYKEIDLDAWFAKSVWGGAFVACEGRALYATD